MLLDALTAGAVTVEQAEVLAAVLHRIDALPDLDAGSDDGEAGGEGEAGAAAEFMVEQAALLSPPELERAGQAVVEALTRSPSVDDPADDAAEAREHERAERELQDQERNWLRVIDRPGGRVRVGTELGPVGAAGFLAWCRRIEKPAPGVDGFEDTRSPAERRGDALADLFTTDSPTNRPGGKLGGETAAADQTDLREPDLLELDIDDAVDDLLADDPVEDELDADQAGPDLADDADSSVSSEVEMPGLPGQCGAVLNVITSLDQLRAGIPGTGHLDTGAPLSVAAVRQLACEAQVVPIVMNAPPRSSTSAAHAARSTGPNAAPQPSATAAASLLAVTHRPPTATCTTAGGGHEAGRPTWTTRPCSAASITGWCTARTGPSPSPPTATPSCTHRRTSTPPDDPDSTTASPSATPSTTGLGSA